MSVVLEEGWKWKGDCGQDGRGRRTDVDVAKEAESRVCGGDTVSDKTVWGPQPVEHVYSQLRGVGRGGEQARGEIKRGRTTANDGQLHGVSHVHRASLYLDHRIKRKCVKEHRVACHTTLIIGAAMSLVRSGFVIVDGSPSRAMIVHAATLEVPGLYPHSIWASPRPSVAQIFT